MRRFLQAMLLQVVANGFLISSQTTKPNARRVGGTTRLFAEMMDISKMKASEMRKELESYGISTKSFFEKSEFEEALKKARAEGKTSAKNNKSSGSGFGKSSASPPKEDEPFDESYQNVAMQKIDKRQLFGQNVIDV